MKRYFFLGVATVIASLTLSPDAMAQSYKATYCGGNDYITNQGPGPGKYYPHLHCMANVITYSASSTNHKNLLDGGTFNRGQAITACQSGKAKEPIKAVLRQICTAQNQACGGANECG